MGWACQQFRRRRPGRSTKPAGTDSQRPSRLLDDTDIDPHHAEHEQDDEPRHGPPGRPTEPLRGGRKPAAGPLLEHRHEPPERLIRHGADKQVIDRIRILNEGEPTIF